MTYITLLRGGMTRPVSQPAKVTPFAGGNEGTSAKAPQATFANQVTMLGS
jgi:hypothetical protein